MVLFSDYLTTGVYWIFEPSTSKSICVREFSIILNGAWSHISWQGARSVPSRSIQLSKAGETQDMEMYGWLTIGGKVTLGKRKFKPKRWYLKSQNLLGFPWLPVSISTWKFQLVLPHVDSSISTLYIFIHETKGKYNCSFFNETRKLLATLLGSHEFENSKEI